MAGCQLCEFGSKVLLLPLRAHRHIPGHGEDSKFIPWAENKRLPPALPWEEVSKQLLREGGSTIILGQGN